jgi:hypothetical protein
VCDNLPQRPTAFSKTASIMFIIHCVRVCG